MHIPVALLTAVCALLRVTVAVLADDAWNVDYHIALLGAPQEHTTFFHQPFVGSKASLLYTLSERHVLGAVNPKDGSVVWRQVLDNSANSTTSSFLRTGEAQDIVVSGTDKYVSAWSASDGRQAWNHNTVGSLIKDLEIVEIPDASQSPEAKDVLVLSTGTHSTLERLDGGDGHAKWTFTDNSGDEAYQVSASATQIFCIFLHPTSKGGPKIKVVSLDPTNGSKIDQYTLNSDSDLQSSAHVLSVGANTASPIIAWTDKAQTVLKVNVVGNKATSSFPIDDSQKVERVTLHAPFHVNARPHFLVHYQTAQDHWAEVYHVDLRASSVTKAYSLPRLAGEGVFSTTVSDANVYFARISESEVSVVSSASQHLLATWPLEAPTGASIVTSRKPVHAVAEVSVKSNVVSAIRMAVYMDSGDWILLRDGSISWERPEVLSSVVSAVWAYPSTAGDLVHELEVEGHSGLLQAYIHRLTRHIGDLKALPAFVSALPGRLVHSIGIGHSTLENNVPAQNTFGFHKTVVCTTKEGRLIALDAGSSGSILWNRQILDLKAGEEPQVLPQPDGTILVKSSSGKTLRKIDAITGKDAKSKATSSANPDSTAKSSVSFTYSFQDGKLVGKSAAGHHTWQFSAGLDQHITAVTPRPLDDPVASIGKVLGDRRVLYKYLNPNTVLVTVVSDVQNMARINVVDTVSGSTIYSTIHDDVDVTRPIASTLSENWFAYSYTSATAQAGSKGHHLVIGEMFESPLPNDRGPRGAAANTSAIAFCYEPYVMTQTYHIPEPISHMAVTQTRQGITSRLLLAVLPESGAVVGIPRSIVDPRRPVGRDPTTTELMEGLVRYDPVLRFDPKWYLTHRREVLGIESMTTSPALLESTSLIFAYGLDLFGTRASPSFSFDVLGKDFNKLQMLATVVALAVATLLVAPLVKRKQINARWQFAQ